VHSNFIELKHIDKEINNNIIFDSLYSLDINKEYQITVENINLVKNIKRKYEEWLSELTNQINKFLNCLFNYCLTQEKMISYIKKDKENSFLLLNYQLFNKNNLKIVNYLQTINDTINNDEQIKEGIEKKSIIFLRLLKNIEDKKYFSLNILNNNEENERLILENQKFNIKQKIGEMNRIKLKTYSKENNEIISKIECFCPFQNNKYIIFGSKHGEIQIYLLSKNPLSL
jgi:hypothetical protein